MRDGSLPIYRTYVDCSLRRVASPRRARTRGKLYVLSNIVNLGNIVKLMRTQFYNLAIFMSSIAVFSLVAQRMTSAKAIG
ncbi:hypothetical protein IG631_10326 [Alternaria alternata]|nr:hypothetical protein IG631_10326 [Alternaria alternata]